jgi:FK506-binding nuclear protein
MASIDPTEEVESKDAADKPQRSTLKIIRLPGNAAMDDDSEDDKDYSDEDDFSDESDESDLEVNGGPSDLTKAKKSKKQALLEATAEDSDEDMDEDEDDEDDSLDEAKITEAIQEAIKGTKGKGKVLDDEEDSEEDSDDDSDDLPPQEVVVCTLDTNQASLTLQLLLSYVLTPRQHFQQPLNLTFAKGEMVFFQVSGTHTIHVTGNYVDDFSVAGDTGHDFEEDEYDLSPNEDELDGLDALIGPGSESDELDDLEDPRVKEVDSEEEVPKLIKDTGKASKKRAHDDSSDEDKVTSEDIQKAAERISGAPKDAATTNGEPKKLSKAEKKRLKKLKNNEGDAAPAPSSSDAATKKDTQTNGTASSAEKKSVQFAKNLEQGPTSSTAAATKDASKDTATNSKAQDSQGVKIDVRDVGSGPKARKGSKVEMRYIGKLSSNNKVFDSNKKGPPFKFTLGSGEVIKGWDLGLEGIQAGGTRRITIPPKHAYGNKAMKDIPKNSELVFDVKCLSVA